jgi:hypothetical protein
VLELVLEITDLGLEVGDLDGQGDALLERAAELDQAGGDLLDDLHRLRERRLELGPGLQYERPDLASGGGDEVAAEGVVGGGGGHAPRVQLRARLEGVGGAADRLDRVTDPGPDRDRGGLVGLLEVFPVGVPDDAALPVVGGVAEGHRRVDGRSSASGAQDRRSGSRTRRCLNRAERTTRRGRSTPPREHDQR